MAMSKLLSANALHKLLQSNTAGLRILDCTYNVTAKPDYKEWRKQNFGKFEELSQKDSPQKQQYLQSHIPTARFMDLDVAMYPSKFERLAHYEPEIFQDYMQLLGIHHDDQIVLYSRGPMGGMLFSAKCYWLLRSYGHKEVSILDGGLDAWKKEGFELESKTELEKVEKGNWFARNFRHKLVAFEELTEKDASGKDIFERAMDFNILDARFRAQYNNEQDTGLNSFVVPGSFIPGTRNAPVAEFVGKDGKLVSEDIVREKLAEADFDPEKPTITLCNSGIQAAFLATIIDNSFPQANIRLFNGSMKEVEARAPQRINGGIKPVAPSQ
ncbi:hypothetical protein FO519_008791 [Halicephalobus sp. NKZ332]|nr:hypothetical protein FO519_008791 [Halicephalobus sp. NKZ332]